MDYLDELKMLVKRLKDRRAQYTIAAACEDLEDVSPTTVSRWLDGKYIPTVSRYQRFCASVRKLLGDEA